MNQILWLAQQEVPEESVVAAVAIFSTILLAFLIALAVGLAINIVICTLLYMCFNRIPPEHRKMQPGFVWLLLIPVFGLIWNFFIYLRLPESFQSYFSAQGRTDVGDCGRGVGLWYAICAAAAFVPCVNYVAAPAALVLVIIFLVKAFDLRGQIPQPGMD